MSEEISDVQFRLEPRFPPYYNRAIGAEDLAALRRLTGRDEEGSQLLEDANRVADDLTSWRRLLAFGGPLPVPVPEVAAAAIDDPERRAALIPEVFGDIATVLFGESVGRIPVEAVDVVTRIDPTPNPDSRIRLGSDRDALGMRIVELDWQLSTADRSSVARATELLGAELGRAELGRLRLTFGEEDAPGPRTSPAVGTIWGRPACTMIPDTEWSTATAASTACATSSSPGARCLRPPDPRLRR